MEQYIIVDADNRIAMAKKVNTLYQEGYRLVSYTPTWYYVDVPLGGGRFESSARQEIHAVMEKRA